MYSIKGNRKISSVASCRAIGFEEKAMRDGKRKIVIECIKREKEGDKKVGCEDRELFLR